MPLSLRLQWVLAVYGRAVVLALLVLGFAFAGAGVFVYTNPGSDVVTEQVGLEDASTTLLTSAVVVNNTTLYEPGSRLVNQPVYVVEATPDLTFHVQTRVPPDREVDVSQRLTYRLAASRKGEVFWESTTVLLDESIATSDGQAVSSTTVNVSELAEEMTLRRGQVGTIDEFTSELVLEVDYDTGRYQGSLEGRTPLVFTSDAYWVEGDISRTRTHGETVTQEVARVPDATTTGLLGAVGVAFLAMAGGLERLRRRDVDQRALELQLELARFDDWISEGQVITDPDRKYVLVPSVKDLVDIAIDSEKRVIHDPEFEVYAVVDDDIVYYLSAGPYRVDDWLQF